MNGKSARTAWLVAVVVLLAFSGVAAAMALAPSKAPATWGDRDEALFLAHVKEYFGGAHPEPASVDDSVYVREGDRACEWLSAQPVVSGAAPDQASYEMFSMFLEEVEPPDDWPFDNDPTGVRGSVVYDAWHYLCPAVRESRIWQPSAPSD